MGPDHAESLVSLPVLPEAACRNHPTPDVFFPEDIRNFTDRVFAAASAFATCHACPIQAKCLAFGLEKENLRYGIYGGLLPGERLALVKSRSKGSATLIQEAKKLRRAFAGVESEDAA